MRIVDRSLIFLFKRCIVPVFVQQSEFIRAAFQNDLSFECESIEKQCKDDYLRSEACSTLAVP